MATMKFYLFSMLNERKSKTKMKKIFNLQRLNQKRLLFFLLILLNNIHNNNDKIFNALVKTVGLGQTWVSIKDSIPKTDPDK